MEDIPQRIAEEVCPMTVGPEAMPGEHHPGAAFRSILSVPDQGGNCSVSYESRKLVQ
jgi:hypothetical protein